MKQAERPAKNETWHRPSLLASFSSERYERDEMSPYLKYRRIVVSSITFFIFGGS